MKILIIKPSSFGDIIHGLQVAQAIKDQVPQAEISWVVRDLFEPLVTYCTAIDDVFLFRRNDGLWAFLRLIREIRKKRYDWVLDFQGLARSGLLTLIARSKHKAVRSDARELSGMGFWHRAPLPAKGKSSHAIDILLKFLGVMGLKEAIQSPLQFAFDKTQLHIPQEINLEKSILIFPNSRRPEKEWKEFTELTDLILKEYPDKQVVWLGQSAIHSRAEWPESRFFNLIARTNVQEVIHFVSRAPLVISNDSGPMHLAAAFKKPLIALFGPTDPALFGPYPLNSAHNTVITSTTEDISRISVDQVFNEVRKKLE